MRWQFFPALTQTRYYVQAFAPIVTALCTETAFIEVETNGWSIEWTQVSGTPIVIVSPNAVRTEILVNHKTGPFVFRATINNDPDLFAEVTVSTNPLEAIDGFSVLYASSIDNPAQRKLPRLLQPITRSLQDAYDLNENSEIVVTWDLPGDLEFFVQTQWQEYDNGVYTVLPTVFTAKSDRKFTAKVNRRYRAIHTFQTYGRISHTISEPLFIAVNEREGKTLGDDSWDGFAVLCSSGSSKVQLGVIRLILDEPINGFSAGSIRSTATRVEVSGEKVVLDEPINGFSTGGIRSTFTRVPLTGVIIG